MSSGLTVVALGGNAVSPARGGMRFDAERAAIASAADELTDLARTARLLVVHGNGPQVGRLLAAPELGDPGSLDVHVAQTQGELGYLLAEALETRAERPCVALVTRVLVDPNDGAFEAPTKPVGPVLAARPRGAPAMRTPDGRGWRRVVASPRPHAVVELEAIRALLATHHVIAGGGGGVALARRSTTRGARAARSAVVDKDWVAALLATALGAERLVFVTDVSGAFDAFGRPEARGIPTMRIAEARERLAGGVFAPGSMAPKVESAIEFVQATGRPAVIAELGSVATGLRGTTGTTIVP
ncbi:MAG TPA: carbamate kinase [Candidatus Eisenbacteria bacterium]|nr:carbamate kinase [Candidatus Eisenbacteria bacterium]